MFEARDRKQHSASLGSEVDDEEAKGSQDNDLEKMTVPKPKGANEEDDDSEDDLEDRSVYESFDCIIASFLYYTKLDVLTSPSAFLIDSIAK